MTSTIAPSEEEKRDLYNLANNIPFDDRVNHEAALTDLNLTLIQAYLKEINSSLYEESQHMDFIELCRNMNIVNSLPEYTKPKNVGLMFFSLEPQRFFPYAQIDVVQFPDGLGEDNIIEKTFKGPLHQQLREALLYIHNLVITEQVIKHDDRAEADRFFNYPYAAIEESLCNAVYHKGYDVREPIEVRVLPDRIEIVSHPGADRSITPEGLRTYRVFNRRYRNRRIGEFLKEMHLTEGRNTGFKKILNALTRNGSPMPIFETDPERLSFSTTIFIHPYFLHHDEGENEGENPASGISEGENEGKSEEENPVKALNEGENEDKSEGRNDNEGRNEGINEGRNPVKAPNEGTNEGKNPTKALNKGENEGKSEGRNNNEGRNEGENPAKGLSEGENEGRNHETELELTEKESAVLSLMQEDSSISGSQIASITGIPLSTVERTIKKLKALKRISHEGPNKGGKWVVL